MAVRIEVKLNRFPEGPALLKQAIAAAFASEGTAILSDMEQRTPVDTGALRSSESVTNTDTSMTFVASTDYALYVHQGTSRMGARPFMRDAVNAGMPRITEAIIREATSALG